MRPANGFGHGTNLGHADTSAHKAFRLGFRADIEGLRAVAVSLVVAAHAGVSWLAGGFVGVDVFFVLSGYLITGLLVQELRSTGTIRLVDFYARRLQRLLPALLVMVFVSSLSAAALLAPFEQPVQAQTARAATVWLSNLFFVTSRLDYFGPAAESNLFLHTWSLGVEEQFYLVWPMLVLFLVGAWRWQGRTRDFARLTRGMLATIGICLALCIFLTYTRPAWGFYLMPARAWQFALGAVAWQLSRSAAAANAGVSGTWGVFADTRISALLGWSGLAMILAAALLLDTHTVYPGGWALLPSVGAALVLWAGSRPSASGAGLVLSLPPMQWLGRVSYAWYLWHWPVLILGTAVVVMDRPPAPTVLALVSLGLAAISYGVVEAPLRRARWLAGRPRTVLVTSVLLMVGAVLLGRSWQSAAGVWMRSPDQQRYTAVRSDLPAPYRMGCDDWFSSSSVKICGFGARDAQRTAVLIGDSAAVQWFPAVANAYAAPDWRLLVITKSACPMVKQAYFYPRIGREYVECTAWRDAALATVQSLRPDVVLMGSTITYPFTPAQWTAGTTRVLDMIAPYARSVFILRATPLLPFDAPGCLARRDWRSAALLASPACGAPGANTGSGQILSWLNQAASAYPNVEVVDLHPLVCPDNTCEAQRGDMIVFRDAMHVTARYVESVSAEFARRVGRQ